MIPTAAQLTKLRSKPHLTKLYLSVYQPTTILACRVNDLTATKGEREIIYDSVTAGSYLLVQSGMTMYIGTSAGAFDKGVIRVRSATSSVITVAENSHINWSDNDYLTIVNFYEISAVFPRIIQDPVDETNTLWYKDYDIAYTNQNSILGTFINMGSHFSGFLEGGTCQVYYSASGTYNLLNESLSYHWFFEGGTPSGSNAHTPGNIAYSTPGHYTTRLIVSGSSTGAVDKSYRHISIYNKLGQGQSTPIKNWELAGFSGSREQGGYIVKIRVHEIIPSSTLRDGSLITIFAEDWYGDTLVKQSLGGNALGRESIVFCGYIIRGSIRYNYRDSSVEFDVGSPTEIMKISEGFSVSIRDSADPATGVSDTIPSAWVLILNMDTRRALYHYLRWHSTVLMTNDFRFIGTDRPLQYFDADRASLYDAISTGERGILLGSIVCDRQGRIWAERDIYLEQSAFQTSFTLSNQDWMNDIGIDEQRQDRVSFIEMGGIAYFGVTGGYLPLLSNAPGVTPGYRGGVERTEGLSLVSQSELNTIVGNVFANKNSEYPNIDIEIAGNYRNYDIAPQEIIPLTIESDDTARGIVFTNKSFYLTRMEWEYSPELEYFRPRISLSELVTGFAGDAVDIPPAPNIESGGFNIPTIQIPQIVIPPFPVLTLQLGSAYPFFVPPILEGTTDTPITNDGKIWLSPTVTPWVALSAGLYIPIDCPYTQLIVVPVYSGQGGDAGNIVGINRCDGLGVDGASDIGTVSSGTKTVTVQEPDNQLFSYATDFGLTVTLIKDNVINFQFTRNGNDASDTYGSYIIFAGWKLTWI